MIGELLSTEPKQLGEGRDLKCIFKQSFNQPGPVKHEGTVGAYSIQGNNARTFLQPQYGNGVLRLIIRTAIILNIKF